jgi:DNA-binding PadR family transcriptional regulator
MFFESSKNIPDVFFLPTIAAQSASNASVIDAFDEGGMPTAPPDPRSFLPLTPLAFQVLLALADADRHGYGIILEVRERTDGLISLGTGTLYTMLQRLLEESLIAEADRPAGRLDDDQRRKYYGLTPLGRDVVAAEARRLQGVLTEAQRKNVFARRELGDTTSGVAGPPPPRRRAGRT